MRLNVTPELIPHKRFHTGIWLQPVERLEWYYFLKQRNTNAIKNNAFLKSVDKPIRNLVSWLHKRGIRTTPSCSGHHIAERSLENIYEGLKKDAYAIRNGGLQLKDIETGKLYNYQTANYTLPWSKRDFLRKLITYQKKGVLGIRIGARKSVKEQIRKIQVPGISVTESDGILFIFADNHTGDNRYAWKEVTKKVKRIMAAQKQPKS